MLTPMMAVSNDSWFGVKEVADQVWVIDDNGQDTMYLVAGQEKALLIDTGWGFGDLKDLVGTLTPLPLEVVLTHGHPDHVCGVYPFAKVHIHSADQVLLGFFFREDSRKDFLRGFIPERLPASFVKDDWIRAGLPQVTPVLEGAVFDLGGRRLSVIAIPGHTPGCIGLLDEGAGLLFTGDSILEGQIWMHSWECLPLVEYRKSLQHVASLQDKFRTILPAHARTPVEPEVIRQLITGATDIIEGRGVGVFHHTFIGDGLLYKFGACEILYNEERIS